MMNENQFAVNAGGNVGGIAQIRNVGVCYQAIQRTQQRHALLPGLAVFYGPSGFGKSVAANFVAVRSRAFYIQAKSAWSKKHLLENILREMRIVPANTTAKCADQASAELAKSGRPLIIDEFDHLVSSAKVELIRDLYEGSQGTILIIGEEMLPRKLERWERFHGRVLNWLPALPADINDAKLMQPIYAPHLQLGEDLIESMVSAVRGSTRRIATNLERIQEVCLEAGISSLDMAGFKRLRLEFLTGESPKPRTF